MIDNLLLGLSVAFSFNGLLFLLAGCTLGTIIGILPGIGIVATLAILFPYTYGVSPTYSIIMMAGIYYGAQYSGSTTSILVNTPGEPSSVMTCIDGYKMTQNGRGGQAVVAAGLSSLIGGLITLVLISFLSPIMVQVAFEFGPRELSLLMLLGLVSISAITNNNLFSGIGLAFVGILLGSVGTDITSGVIRFTAGSANLIDGISIPVIAIGVFGIAEILRNLFSKENIKVSHSLKINFGWREFKRILPSSLRGTMVGSFFGMIPGGGTIMSSFAAYTLEKKVSKNKEQIGSGAIEGVSAPESANNAASQISFVPLLTLGIPENAVMALMLGVLTFSGLSPGPQLIDKSPELFWGLLVSMFLGNFILAILNIPLVKIWLYFLRTPKNILYPILLLVSLFGVYHINNSFFEVGLAVILGAFGFILVKLDLEPAPLMFGFVIGPMFEEYVRRSLIISRGDLSYFVEGPTCIILLTVIFLVTAFGIFKTFKNKGI